MEREEAAKQELKEAAKQQAIEALKHLPNLLPPIKEKWVEALRSGNYKQDIGVLREDDRFCCLGVLGDISDEYEWRKEGDVSYTLCRKDDHRYNGGTVYLPGSSLPGIFDYGEGEPTGYNTQQAYDVQKILARLNDDRFSFDDIADVIEAAL